jgi:hypothetical protein
MRLAIVPSLVVPMTLRAEQASGHLARELAYLAVIAGAVACLAVLSAVMLAASLERGAPHAR